MLKNASLWPCTIRFGPQPLGSGVASVVLRGKLDNEIDVAVKRLTTLAGVKEKLLAEADAMLNIAPHADIACLCGLVLDPAAFEFCDGVHGGERMVRER